MTPAAQRAERDAVGRGQPVIRHVVGGRALSRSRAVARVVGGPFIGEWLVLYRRGRAWLLLDTFVDWGEAVDMAHAHVNWQRLQAVSALADAITGIDE